LKRHAQTLKKLRLRFIFLRDDPSNGPQWREVLVFIRREMRLTSARFRGIGYERDAHFMGGTFRANDESDDDAEQSTDEVNDEEDLESVPDASVSANGENDENAGDQEHDSTGTEEESSNEVENSDEAGDAEDEVYNSSPLVQNQCGCEPGCAFNELFDDGITVTKTQWKLWEKWVTMRCSKCDPLRRSGL
jgi:hypothetical protein